MNSVDWEKARRKLIDQGLTDFTDGDIIRTFHDNCILEQKAIDDAAKAVADQAAAAASVIAPDPVVDTLAMNDRRSKSRYGRSIA